MIKNNYNIKIDYIYNPQKKFTKYSLDGVNWYNYGEVAEILYKSVLGYKPTKEKNNSFLFDNGRGRRHNSLCFFFL